MKCRIDSPLLDNWMMIPLLVINGDTYIGVNWKHVKLRIVIEKYISQR